MEIPTRALSRARGLSMRTHLTAVEALAGPDFLSMRKVFVSHCQPIRFGRYDGKSVNRGLPVLDQTRALTRALDPNHRPKGS